MADTGQQDTAAAGPADLELIRTFVMVVEELNLIRAVRAAVEVAASHAEQPAALA
jgi:hypothetical protein